MHKGQHKQDQADEEHCNPGNIVGYPNRIGNHDKDKTRDQQSDRDVPVDRTEQCFEIPVHYLFLSLQERIQAKLIDKESTCKKIFCRELYIFGSIIFKNMKHKIGLILYYAAMVLIVLFGGLYMFKPSFMPYHATIVHLNWEQIPSSEQILVRALMIATGGVTISVGIILGMFLYKFQKSGQQWISNYVMISGILANLLISVAPIYVVIKSDSVPPLYFPAVLIVLLVLGNILTRR
jgi:hypothetical protein